MTMAAEGARTAARPHAAGQTRDAVPRHAAAHHRGVAIRGAGRAAADPDRAFGVATTHVVRTHAMQ